MTDAAPTPLAELIQALISLESKRVGGYQNLAKRIHDSSPNKLGVLERRKLAAIASGQSITLTLNQLHSLDHYLRSCQQPGLANLIAAQSLPLSLVSSGHVTFFLGCKPDPDRHTNNISHWDVRAMAATLRSLYQVRPTIRVELHHVLLAQHAQALTDANYRTTFTGQDWYGFIGSSSSPSVICIGSPRACHATELMLAGMFGIRPFCRGTASKNSTTLPFTFVWSRQEYEEMPSSLAVKESKMIGIEPSLKKFNWRTVGIKIQGSTKPLQVTRRSDRWTTYGIIAAQRRATGQVWVVVSGLSGPDTFAASQCLDQVPAGALDCRVGDCSPVCWAIVEAEVERRPGVKGDDRFVCSQKIVDEVQIWRPADGQPKGDGGCP